MDIILNTNSLNIEQKNHIKPQLEELIIKLASSLNISSLKQIIVPADFTEELVAFQEVHNKIKKGHREGESGTAFAKVISYNESTDFSQAIFLHEAFLLVILGDDGVFV